MLGLHAGRRLVLGDDRRDQVGDTVAGLTTAPVTVPDDLHGDEFPEIVHHLGQVIDRRRDCA